LMVGIGNLFPFEVTSFPAQTKRLHKEPGQLEDLSRRMSCKVARPPKSAAESAEKPSIIFG
jgi:hypothetical protein